MALTEKQQRNQVVSEPGPSPALVVSDHAAEEMAATAAGHQKAHQAIVDGRRDNEIGAAP